MKLVGVGGFWYVDNDKGAIAKKLIPKPAKYIHVCVKFRVGGRVIVVYV